jgi:hypothetical protein
MISTRIVCRTVECNLALNFRNFILAKNQIFLFKNRRFREKYKMPLFFKIFKDFRRESTRLNNQEFKLVNILSGFFLTFLYQHKIKYYLQSLPPRNAPPRNANNPLQPLEMPVFSEKDFHPLKCIIYFCTVRNLLYTYKNFL